ncbi:AMP-binding protein [Nocardia aurantia]|nr:AMP-binding protein [Nocardia aurantia]
MSTTMDHPMTGAQTVATLLAYWAGETPSAPFLVFDDLAGNIELVDYRGTMALARRGAAVLSGLGAGRGDRVALVLDNSVEFFACWFGAALTGSVIVPLSPQLRADDLGYAFGHAGCMAVVCGPAQASAVRAGTPLPVVVTGADFDRRAAGLVPTPVRVRPEDPLAILYTSGTTDRPKGVIVTHANYLTAGLTVAHGLRIRSDDRWLVVQPLFHADAQYYCTMSALVSGASIAVAARFSATRWAAQACIHGATLTSLFASSLRMILAAPETPYDAQNRLRAALFAQNISEAQLVRFRTRFECPLRQLYGMTETVAPPLLNPLFGPHDNATLGLPTASGRVRVVDPDGLDVVPGEVGELLVGGLPGYTLMAGYHDDPEATAAVLADGWLRTGDLVRLRPDGFIAFHDRADDVIRRLGENISAAEVERVLADHPTVTDCAVIGVPVPNGEESIVAFVVCHQPVPHVSELLAHCIEWLPRAKVPDRIDIVDTLPRTVIGRVRKQLLRVGALATELAAG